MLTYDYRGIGGSQKPASATIDQWGAADRKSMPRDGWDELACWLAKTLDGARVAAAE